MHEKSTHANTAIDPAILNSLPHRPPFLFIDGLVRESATHAVAYYVFRADAPYFAGHFPGNPVVPGVLVIEAMAQAVVMLFYSEDGGKESYLVGIERARFRRIVRPNERVDIDVTIVNKPRMGLYTADCVARVGSDVVALARLKGMAKERTF